MNEITKKLLLGEDLGGSPIDWQRLIVAADREAAESDIVISLDRVEGDRAFITATDETANKPYSLVATSLGNGQIKVNTGNKSWVSTQDDFVELFLSRLLLDVVD